LSRSFSVFFSWFFLLLSSWIEVSLVLKKKNKRENKKINDVCNACTNEWKEHTPFDDMWAPSVAKHRLPWRRLERHTKGLSMDGRVLTVDWWCGSNELFSFPLYFLSFLLGKTQVSFHLFFFYPIWFSFF
jgi:hypothetical protein